MAQHDPASTGPARPNNGAPLPDARRLMVASILAIAILAISVVAAAIYAVQQVDRVAIGAETERAIVALRTVGSGPEAAERLRTEYLLDGARLTSPRNVAEAEVSIPVPGNENAVLAWTPNRIGTTMLYHLAPLRIAVSGVFLFGVAVVLRRLYRMTRELEARRREAQRMATRDALTGLGNRLAFDEWLGRSSEAEVGLLLLDLDGFKGINDTLGHGAGDEVLKIVAERISGLASPQDLLARIGGDEFALARRGPVSRAELAELAADIGTALSEPMRLGANDLAVGASIGIAAGRAGDPDLIASADAALYRAKALPGHTFVFSEAA